MGMFYEDVDGEYKFEQPSNLQLEKGNFVNFCSSSFVLTEYYRMPYNDKNGSGEIFVREGDGMLFVARNGAGHTYAYGQPVDDTSAAILRPIIEKTVGSDFDALISRINEQSKIESELFERAMEASKEGY